MRLRRLLVVLVVLVTASVGAVWSKHQQPARLNSQHEMETAPLIAAMASTHMDMGPHMRMTAVRPPQAGDEQRAGEVASRARQAIEKYQDYRVALRDGYEILLPRVPQQMYHFNHPVYYVEAERHFNVEHPTSLLYEKNGGGYRLIGLMYTAPAELTEDELNERIPLSVAHWHQHVNICLPEGDPLQNLFGNGTRFGLDGSISTAEECHKVDGQFYPRLFGWMVHLYPDEQTSEAMWSVERQMPSGAHHIH